MSQTGFILIVSDDEARGAALRDELRDRYGHSCNVVSAPAEAHDSIRQRAPDVVVAPVPLLHGAELDSLVGLLESAARDATVVVVGANGPLPRPRSVRLLATPDPGDWRALAVQVNQAAERSVARREDRLLKESLESAANAAFEGLVGVTPSMQRIITQIRKAPPQNKLTVLILGETGTGKELIARAIHNQSDRRSRPFREINCAGFNESLLESQLFGHVKGAFTGAINDHKGLIQAADSGTLFLDEIGDMPLTMQAKLLRALEQREIIPVGSTEVRKVDIRLVAATNANLPRLIEERKFREDLFYRLNQWVIHLPPLRERRPDIALLAHHLLQRANATHGVAATGISSEAMALLTRYIWPGNVRELSNVLEAAACAVLDRQIEADDLPEHIRGSREIVPAAASGIVGLSVAQVERMLIERTLQATSGNREQAAKMLKIGIRTLYRKIKEYGL